MSCATRCVKYLLVFFNLIIAIFGSAALTIGILLQLNIVDHIILINSDSGPIGAAPIVLIILGTALCVISLIGCAGAVTNNIRLLITYVVALLVIFIIQIAVGFFVLFRLNCTTDLKASLRYQLKDSMEMYNNNTLIQRRIDLLQSKLFCCGVDGPSDWEMSTIPLSCCEGNVTNCTILSTELFTSGCLLRAYERLTDIAEATYIVTFSLALIEAIGVILGSLMINSVRNDLRRDKYRRYMR